MQADMSSVSLSFGLGGSIELQKPVIESNIFAPNFFGSAFKGINGLLLKRANEYRGGQWRKNLIVGRIRKGRKHEYPWPDDIDPNLKTGHLSYLSHFKPLTEKPKLVTLPFEKPLVDLEKKIMDVRQMADETGLDFSDQINLLESKYQQALKDLYARLTPIQRLSIARHPNRPTFLDHVLNITDKWVELHGDRAGYDDPAVVTGIGSIDGKSYLFIGHQKGRNTKENIERNFGMPTPHGYRKALRLMRYADHHGFPIITFVDTPGAYADLKSEELGQGEAIAYNLREMFGFKVPIVSVVIGEGGSGGALAIACANKLYMLENSVFYVASPEACAAILWKSAQAAPKAAEKLRITATELCKLDIADGIIPEPLGGAHTDPSWTSQQIKRVVLKAMNELSEMDTEKLLQQRHLKFRKIGGFQDGGSVDPERKRNMKPADLESDASTTSGIEADIEMVRKKILEADVGSGSPVFTKEAIEKLQREVDQEIASAFISMGLRDRLEALKLEISKSSGNPANQPALKEKADKLKQDFDLRLNQPGSYLKLKQKMRTLTQVNRLVEQKARIDALKMEINTKLQNNVKQPIEVLKKARDIVMKGETLGEEMIAQVEKAKEVLKEALNGANLEVLGTGKKIMPSVPPEFAENFAKIDEEIRKEIEKAVGSSNLRSKIEKMKLEFANGEGANKEELGILEMEIKEGVAAIVNTPALKQKIDNMISQTPVSSALAGIDAAGADNGKA